jgi:hypothetical protein
MRSVGKDAILQTVFTARNKCRRHGSIRNEMDVPDRLRATNSTITIDPTCQRPRPDHLASNDDDADAQHFVSVK